MPPQTPRTLRRVSQAMSEFMEEVVALQSNVEGMKHFSKSLATFNESFASWLYIMKMNSLTADWPQAPIDVSFELGKQRTAEREALAAMEVMQKELAQAAAEPPPEIIMTDGDATSALLRK